MKVVVSHALLYGAHSFDGGSRRLLSLAKALLDLGVDTEYVTSRLNGVREFKCGKLKIRTINVPFNSFKKFVGTESYVYAYFLRNTLNKLDFDILHTPTGMFYTLQRRRKPVLLEVYDLELITDREPLRMAIKRCYYGLRGQYSLYRHALMMAEGITVENASQFELLRHFCPGVETGKVYQLPSSVDLKEVDRILSSTSSGIERGQLKGEFVIITTNRFTYAKGLDYLVKAFAGVKREIHSVRLVMVGGGPESGKRAIEKLVNKLGLADAVTIKLALDH
jgi:glycosyltransferase involved in cell wall biosynthesis